MIQHWVKAIKTWDAVEEPRVNITRYVQKANLKCCMLYDSNSDSLEKSKLKRHQKGQWLPGSLREVVDR